MQGIVKLALEAPFKLRVVEVSGMEIKVVGMNGDIFVFELDNDLDPFAFRACGEVQQRMFVQAQLRQNAVETGINQFWHGRDCIASSERADPALVLCIQARLGRGPVPFS